MEPDLRLLIGPVYVLAFGALARWGIRSKHSPFLGALLAGLGLMPLYFAPVAFAAGLAIPGSRLPRTAGLTLGLLLGYGLGAIALVVTGFERFDLR